MKFVHACARNTEDQHLWGPKSVWETHGASVENLVKYLAVTKNSVLILDPQNTRSLEVYADYNFIRNWNNPMATKDVSTAKLRMNYVIVYLRWPIIWMVQRGDSCCYIRINFLNHLFSFIGYSPTTFFCQYNLPWSQRGIIHVCTFCCRFEISLSMVYWIKLNLLPQKEMDIKRGQEK